MHAREAGPASWPVNRVVPNLGTPAAAAQDSNLPLLRPPSQAVQPPQEHQIQAPDQVSDPQTNDNQTQEI